MRTIQEVGTEILTGNPGKFYAFTGPEYGIKVKYLQILENHYGVRKEVQSVNEVLDLMSKKHIFPLNPALYVIRYDEEFIGSLKDSTAKQIDSARIIGTIVCIYESTKHTSKLDKYLSNYTVCINPVSPQFIIRYLHDDFPKLPDRLIAVAVDMASDYNQAKNICLAMEKIPVEEIFKLSDSEIFHLFGKLPISTDTQVKKGIASRNFSNLIRVLNTYPDDLDKMLYAILSTMVELDKLMDNGYTQSDIRDYKKRWTREDVYNMFMYTYDVLQKSRTVSNSLADSIVYLFGLLQFSSIPDFKES